MTGKHLKEYLNKRPGGFNLSKLADAIGITKASLTDRFTASDIKHSFLKEISTHLAIPMAELLALDNQEGIVNEPSSPYGVADYKDLYIGAIQKVERVQDKLIEVQAENITLRKQLSKKR